MIANLADALAEIARMDALVKTFEARCAALEQAQEPLRGLLAILNRDGGHRQAEVGVPKAVQEAQDRYYDLLRQVEELSAALVEAAIPLEALNLAEAVVPVPLAPEMNEGIAKALAVIRAALAPTGRREA